MNILIFITSAGAIIGGIIGGRAYKKYNERHKNG